VLYFCHQSSKGLNGQLGSQELTSPEAVIHNTSTLVGDIYTPNKSSKVTIQLEQASIDETIISQQTGNKSSFVQQSQNREDRCKPAFQQNVSPHSKNVERESHSRRPVTRSSSTVEQRNDKKENPINDNSEISNNSNIKQIRYASQNHINSESPDCLSSIQHYRPQYTKQRSSKLLSKTSVPNPAASPRLETSNLTLTVQQAPPICPTINPANNSSSPRSSQRTPQPRRVNLVRADISREDTTTAKHQTNELNDENSRTGHFSHQVNHTHNPSKLSQQCTTPPVHYFSNPELQVVSDTRQSHELRRLLQLLKDRDAELKNLRVKLSSDNGLLQTAGDKQRDHQTKSSDRQAVLERRLADLVAGSIRRDKTFKSQLTFAQNEIYRLQDKLSFKISEKEAIEIKYRDSQLENVKLERDLRECNYVRQSSLIQCDGPVDRLIPTSNKSSSETLDSIKYSFTGRGSQNSLREHSIPQQSISSSTEPNKECIGKEVFTNYSPTCSSSHDVGSSNPRCVNNEHVVNSTALSSSVQYKHINMHIQDCPETPTMLPLYEYECQTLTFPDVPSVYAQMECASELFYLGLNNSTHHSVFTETNKILPLTKHSQDGSTDFTNGYCDDTKIQPPASPRQCMQIFNGFNVDGDILQQEKESRSVANLSLLPEAFTHAQIPFSAELFHPGLKSPVVTADSSADSQTVATVTAEQINELTEEATKARDDLEICRQNFEVERKEWLDDKNKVINYHSRLEEHFVQLIKQNKLLEQQLNRLGRLPGKYMPL